MSDAELNWRWNLEASLHSDPVHTAESGAGEGHEQASSRAARQADPGFFPVQRVICYWNHRNQSQCLHFLTNMTFDLCADDTCKDAASLQVSSAHTSEFTTAVIGLLRAAHPVRDHIDSVSCSYLQWHVKIIRVTWGVN